MIDMVKTDKPLPPGYTPERIRGLEPKPENLNPKLGPGERSEKWRIRTQNAYDYAWLKALTSPQRGELIAWARAQKWTPDGVDEVEYEVEEDEE